MLLLSLLPFAICLLEAPGDGEQERARPRVPSDAATLPRLPPAPPPVAVSGRGRPARARPNPRHFLFLSHRNYWPVVTDIQIPHSC